jgi:predicted CxxxxCH...CXXCH cytochrome family protein
MGWCVNCHVNGYKPAEGARLAGVEPTAEQQNAQPIKARYDCSSCHM